MISAAVKLRVLNFARAAKRVLLSNIVLSLGLGAGITAITLNLDFYRAEAFFYDLRVRLAGTEAPDNRIAVVAISGDAFGNNTDSSMNTIGTHTQVLERLISEKPSAIAFLNRFDPSDIELNAKDAKKFMLLARAAEKQGIRILVGTDVDLGGEILAPYPLSQLTHYPAIIHKDGTIFSEDKVTRRALLTVVDEPSLPVRLAYPLLDDAAIKQKISTIRGAHYFKPGEAWHVLLHYPGNTSIDKQFFPVTSYADFLQGKSLPNLHGKIVLIDSMERDSVSDFVFTPYSREPYMHPKLFIQAVTLNTLLKDNGIVRIGDKFNYLVTLLLCILLTYITLRYSPMRGVVSVVLTSALLFTSSVLLFKFAGVWLQLAHPLFAMFFAYYLIVPYRAILEYKMRWEVQQKHDILLTVEEMKGNFLSLMSHDLKTPVARIQGFAELILRQGNLSGEQEREVREILYSTESLDKFISKILNLTKVESSQIKLNRKSKDINKIIETCAHKLSFQAQSKKIQLELKLEPLFPLQIDASLIIQVLTNILDNAIKYSPEGSKIEVSSRELSDKNRIEIRIADTGHGMGREEVTRLFTKFYRGDAASGQQLKGSGLGLYLSKYFIELHNGEIRVDSQKDRGSVFTIFLPMHVAEDRSNEGAIYV